MDTNLATQALSVAATHLSSKAQSRDAKKLHIMHFLASLGLAGMLTLEQTKQCWASLCRQHMCLEDSIAGQEKITTATLKDVLKRAQRKVSGSKDQLLSLVPRTVPPELIAEAKNIRRELHIRRERQARQLQQQQRDEEARRIQARRTRGYQEPLPDDEDAYICSTRAKQEWRLTENDLYGLDCKRVRNPHYRSADPMRLFKLSDVVAESCAKHGGPEGLMAYEEKLGKRKRR